MTAPIGFSTGSLSKLDLSLVDSVRKIADAGCAALELMFFTPEELEAWDTLRDEDSALIKEEFAYVSLHAPAKGISFKKGDEKAIQILSRLGDIVQAVGAQSVTFHADVLAEADILQHQSFTTSFENLTDRQGVARNVSEMQELFQRVSDARMTFDINHAFDEDPTGNLARDLVQKFRDRIVQLHISGLRSDQHHTLYSASESDAHFEIIRQFAVPLIHEGYIEEISQMRDELRYIEERLSTK